VIVCVDTNVVVYLVEKIAGWGPKAAARLAAIRAAGDEVAVGDGARLECLLKPLKSGDAVLENHFRTFFADPRVHMLPVTVAIRERAARIGAAFNFKGCTSRWRQSTAAGCS